MLTNFPTIRKAVKKMASIDKMATDGTYDNLSKREKLQITRQRAKLEKNLGSIADMTRQPSALFVIDVCKEHIAVHEAKRLGIPVFAMVDTNSDPSDIDFVIPANDDAAKSISLIIEIMCKAIDEGLNERKAEKDKESAPAEKEETPEGGRRARFRAVDYEEEKVKAVVAQVDEAIESAVATPDTETEEEAQ
jgi:small subunit ribosomal protein S2